MSNTYKQGGGNRPQPYIPSGNGDKSGEYTYKGSIKNSNEISYNTRNKKGCFNFYKSSKVETVTQLFIAEKGESIPTNFIPNSVAKKVINDCVVTERYYNDKGEAYLDIDYSCHGNPKRHPSVPHIHMWFKDENGILIRGEWEDFQ